MAHRGLQVVWVGLPVTRHALQVTLLLRLRSKHYYWVTVMIATYFPGVTPVSILPVMVPEELRVTGINIDGYGVTVCG